MGTLASFDMPKGLAIASDDSVACIADFDANGIRTLTLATGAVTTLCGGPLASNSRATVDGSCTSTARFYAPWSLALTADDEELYVGTNDVIRKVDINAGTVSTILASSQ